MTENTKKIISVLEDAKDEIDRVKRDLDDAESEIDRAIELIEEKGLSFKTPVIDSGLNYVLAWFESPFVNDYDKQTVLSKYKTE